MGADDKPVMNTYGFASWEAEYNRFSICTAQHYFNENGQPCNNTRGVASWRMIGDNIHGNSIIEYYDVNGKTVVDRNKTSSANGVSQSNR